jgi:excinuclease ABC subunit C
MNRKVSEKLGHVTGQPGVYLFKNEVGKVIYVGKAKNLRNRVRSYFRESGSPDPKTGIMVSKVRDFETILVDNEVEALILESNLIKKHKPRYY